LSVSARSVAAWPTPYFAAAALVLSSSRPTSETASTPSISLIASRCLSPKAPAPASATLRVLLMNVALKRAVSRGVFQNEMPDRGVGRGDMIEPVRNLRLWAAGDDIRHRAARNQPHHEFDPFRSRLPDVFEIWGLRQANGVIDQPVEEGVVPFLVDQAGA